MTQFTPSRFSSERILQWVVGLPRVARIACCVLFALAVTLVITPPIDRVYLENFYSPDTVMLPLYAAMLVGVLYYALGWRWIVGYAGKTPEARPVILWYVRIGVAACVLVLVLLVIGAFIGTVE